MLHSLHVLPWKAIAHLFGLPQMTAIMSQDDHQASPDSETQQTHKGILETDAVEVQVKTSMDERTDRIVRIDKGRESLSAFDL
jgi:hypothetical protein